jgi:hypothetical protein
MRTTLNIYGFIATSAGGPLVPEGINLSVIGVSALKWFIILLYLLLEFTVYK